ncbi:MAG TPA: PH domain-containing protein [Mycobacteriales bacterium]|nr:PH domain-containing protein [Mycobacteriales bacterium]
MTDPGRAEPPAGAGLPAPVPAAAGGPTGGASEVRARPERLRRWSALVAGALVLISAVVTLVSSQASNGERFGAPDRIALFGIGLLLAAGVLQLRRPALVADQRGLRVRNLGGERAVPWELVRAISVPGRALWAQLELVDDETVPLLAVQVADGDRTVATVRALRDLLTRYGPAAGQPPAVG